jgi:hypothetical protein
MKSNKNLLFRITFISDESILRSLLNFSFKSAYMYQKTLISWNPSPKQSDCLQFERERTWLVESSVLKTSQYRYLSRCVLTFDPDTNTQTHFISYDPLYSGGNYIHNDVIAFFFVFFCSADHTIREYTNYISRGQRVITT